MNLWKEYKSALSETISLYPESVWANWESKGMHLFAKTFTHPNLIKSREVSHFKALTATLSGTIGLGNIAGVAAAIYFGGPGAIFWMWVTAIFGIATKFFTATLSSLYREISPDGTVNAGTMYVIKNGLPKYMLHLPICLLFLE